MAAKVTSANGTSAHPITNVAVERLLLDDKNPRLTSGKDATSQLELLKVLWTEMSVDEVALSIAANGFFPEEALFVIPAKAEPNKYVVVEGNRRLAAVRLLCDEKLRNAVKATDLPKISASAVAKLQKLPVSIYESREELWPYLGFRHINGPKPWDAFSKAKYVAGVKNSFGVSLANIAKSIGDTHSTVQKLYRGYEVLMQAEKSTGFDREDRVRNKFYFSHLYTAVDQGPYQQFLGIDPEKSLKKDPVPRSKFKELRELMVWIYGSKKAEKPPIIQSQNPDLNILRDVIGNTQALSALRSGVSLYRSFDIARGDTRRFQESLSRAKEELVEASGTVTPGYKGDDVMFRVMEDVIEVSQSLYSTMKSKRKKK
jgi:hypothetical protein